jgi:hypothetical protein
MLFQPQNFYSIIGRMIVNDELKGTGKEVVVAYFKAFFWED